MDCTRSRKMRLYRLPEEFDGGVQAAVKMTPAEIVGTRRSQNVFTLSSFHVSDVPLRQFSKDIGPYRCLNKEIIRKAGKNTNKMSGGLMFHLRSKFGSFSHFQGVTAAPQQEKAAPLQHHLASKLHLFCVGITRSVGCCNFSGRVLCKGADVMPWHLVH